MTEVQQIIVTPIGLVTQPNKFGQYPPGALETVLQMHIRSHGVLETSQGWTAKSSAFTVNGGIHIATFGQYALVVYTNTNPLYSWIDLSTGTTVANGSLVTDPPGAARQSISSVGRTSSTITRARIIFAATNAMFLYDASAGAALTQRIAGILPPCVAFASPNPTGIGAGGALKTNTACHVVAILRRKYADGYEIVSAPSPAMFCWNWSTSDANVTTYVDVVQSYTKAGDTVEVYRTRSQAIGGSGIGGTNTGSDYYLAWTHDLTSGEIAGGGFQLDDVCPDSNLGRALYTNAAVSGAGGLALPPPTAEVVATFKSHTFYLNRTDPPTLKFRVPVYWGGMGLSSTGIPAFYRQYGIGSRTVHGTSTSGSAIITGISAADIVGMKVGQQTPNLVTSFPALTRITAVGATTLTLSANATVSGANDFGFVDVIEMDGTRYPADSFSSFVYNGGINRNFTNGTFLRFGNMLGRVYPAYATPGPGIAVDTIPDGDLTISRFLINDQTTPITIRATNGANFVPPLPKIELNETAASYPVTLVPNGLSWSEENQPENVPPLNTAFCGSGEIYAAYPTRDALWIFTSDGLWRLSGTGGDVGGGYDWRIDPVDSTLSLAGPQAGCVLRDTVYAYTNRGLVGIDSSGEIRELTQGRLNDRLPGPPWSTPTWNGTNCIYAVADETNDEIVLKETSVPGRIWVYNTITDTFTQDVPETGAGLTTFGTYSRYLQATLMRGETATTLRAPLSGTWPTGTFSFQPIYADNPFSLRQWNSIHMALGQYNRSVSMYVNPSGAPGLVFCGNQGVASRTGREPNSARYSWGVPRDAPAVNNSLQVYAILGSGSVPCQVLGIAVDFIELTTQRKTLSGG